ncbi:MAG: hypothetical protein Kow0069_05160 [Promethearchaeota archaeon]
MGTGPGGVTWDERRILVDGRPFYVHGVNLFLDPRPLEFEPRRIYDPPLADPAVVGRIAGLLPRLGVNAVRLWPTNVRGVHECQVPARCFDAFARNGVWIVLNLPVNWNRKPPLVELARFVQEYSEREHPNLLAYCVSNEAYHGLTSPTRYLDAVVRLVKERTTRPTLATSANLNFPTYLGADLLGADYFTYRWSISRDPEGTRDVGAVAKMFLEDAAGAGVRVPGLKWLVGPGWTKFLRLLRALAKRGNVSSEYFRRRVWGKVQAGRRARKPVFLAEYGYCDDVDHLKLVFNNVPWRELAGHAWYNWTNFDPDVDGRVENVALFEAFGRAVRAVSAYLRE